jgi:cellulose synthase/poly-beta-1,6-N-acetylglucosamine synthase-like glycosyltransferase
MPVEPDTSLIVTIPCHDQLDLIASLKASLSICERPKGKAEVIVVVNGSEDAEASVIKQNKETVQLGINWIEENPKDWLWILYWRRTSFQKKMQGLVWPKK